MKRVLKLRRMPKFSFMVLLMAMYVCKCDAYAGGFETPETISLTIKKVIGRCQSSETVSHNGVTSCNFLDDHLIDGDEGTIWFSSPSPPGSPPEISIELNSDADILVQRASIQFETAAPLGQMTLEVLVDATGSIPSWKTIYSWDTQCKSPTDTTLPYCTLLTPVQTRNLVTDFFPNSTLGKSYSTKAVNANQFEWIHSDLVNHMTSNRFRVNISGYNNNYTGQPGFFHALKEISVVGWKRPEKICNCHPHGVSDQDNPCNALDKLDRCACREGSDKKKGLEQCIPYIIQILPSEMIFGPEDGGTLVTLSGGYLSGINLEFTLRKTDFSEVIRIVTQNDSMIIGEISPKPVAMTLGQKYDLDLTFATIYKPRFLERGTFTYKTNPTINSILPGKTFLKGGITQTIHGINLDSVVEPVMKLHVKHTNRVVNTSCTVESDVIWRCVTPNLWDRDGGGDLRWIEHHRKENGDKGKLNTGEYSFFLTFILDGFKLYEDRNELRDSGEIYMYDDPSITSFDGETKIEAWKGDYSLTIKGERLLFGCDVNDYSVTVGGTPCTGLHFPDNSTLTCTVPETLSGTQEILVTVGNLRFNAGDVHYLSSFWDDTMIKYIIIGAAILSALVIIIVIVVCVIRRKRNKNNTENLDRDMPFSSDRIAHQFQDGVEIDVDNRYSQTPVSLDLLSAIPPNLKAKLENSRRLVLFSRLKLNKEIGKGQYGKVFVGEFNADVRWQVAIKTMKDENATFENMVKFLEEATMMLDFNHKHILPLLGVSVERNRPYVVLPYMENGDLRKYISNSNNNFQLINLIELTHQVALGMQYLSRMKFVHRDLAARNCMVDKDAVVKIADFGLARDLYEKEYYQHEGHDPLPVKWMAIEVLQGHGVTLQSDVWSFGVLMWEVLTRGLKPYADVDNRELVHYIAQGRRLERPVSAPKAIYDLMLDCWIPSPNARPKFDDIVVSLNNVLAHVNTPEYLNVNTTNGVIKYSAPKTAPRPPVV